jgi:uncharacterized membrane protein YkoI
MNFKSYGRRMVVFVIAAGITLIAAGATWAATDDVAAGAERNRVAAAATKAVGGGKAVDVERSDDVVGAYDVEVRKTDGTEVDLLLDKSLKVLQRENDDWDNDDDGSDDDGWDGDRAAAPLDNDDNPDVTRSGRVDADDRPLTKTEHTKVVAAAAKAVGSGTVTDVEASDDLGTAYEAEVHDRAGTEWDIELDAKFAVVSKSRDS